MVNEMTLLVIFVSLTLNVVSGRSHFGQPSIIIKANNGQIFECVDFYKQPAFENHSLNFQEMPNLAKLQQQQQSTSDFGLEGRRCPLGTVPIMLRSKENVDGFVVPKPHSLPHAVENRDQHCSAKIQTRANDPNNKFFGVSGHINFFKPLVQSSQWSSARIKLINGAESIEAGWMVNPQEFKDNEAHLYASFSVGGKRCINLDCSGFVQVSTGIPLGRVLPNYSEIGGTQIGWNISINKNQADGNWWLSVATVNVGYWPNNLFTTLKDVANQVDFGGEIDNPGMVNPPPGMGNGRQAVDDTRDSSCITQVTVSVEGNVDPPDTESFEDCNLLYTVLDYYKSGPGLGFVIFYGGPVWAGI